ncbi:MAG: hypothetical protein ACKOFC_00865 [Solirubrobacterales bacterium]
MADAELMYRPATELAAMVRDGEISAQELVTCSLERIEALDPEVNAFLVQKLRGAGAIVVEAIRRPLGS